MGDCTGTSQSYNNVGSAGQNIAKPVVASGTTASGAACAGIVYDWAVTGGCAGGTCGVNVKV